MATVYDKSSLFLAPSGVNDGTVFVQKPVPIYGSEQVTNGDFATDSDWIKTSGATISGGKALLNIVGGAYTSISQAFSYTSGRSYVLTAVVQGTSGSNGKQFRFQDRGNNTGGLTISNGTITLNESAQNIRIYWTANSNSDGLVISRASSGDWSFSIDNVSIKEVLVDSADFTFSRGSNLSATRVNADGLIEKGRENIVLHSNDFSQSSWAKLNGASVSSTQVADPFGGTNAWELTFATNNDSRIQQQVTTVNNTVYAFSVWARVTSGTKIVNLGAVGNLQQKTLTTTWQRIQAYAKETDVYGFPQIRKHSAEGEYTIQIYGFQLELGTAATDYIGSAATTGKAGLLENTPRLDYSGGASCPALLLEPQRSNLITQSEYLNGISWNGKIGTSFDTNTTTSPEGLGNSALLKENSSNGSHFAYKDFNLTSGSTYTISIFAKSNGANRNLRFGDGGVGWSSGFNGVFNLTDGTATGGDIESMGDGWYRCSVTGTTNATTSRLIIYSTLGTATSYQGDDSSGVFLYGFQIELGSYISSYIPNHSGGTITRGADVCGGAGDASTFNDSEGVLYAEISALANDGTNRRITISDGGFNNSVQLYYYPISNRVRASVTSGGITSIDATAALSDATNYHKIAIRYKTNDFSLWVDGVEVGTDTSGNAPSGLDELAFNDAGGSNFYGNVKQVLVFNTALSDTDCEILTGATTYETFEEMALALNYTVYE